MTYVKSAWCRNPHAKYRFGVYTFFTVLLALIPLPIYGQGGRATINGVVTDQSGALVSGAAVTLTDTLTGQATAVVTATDGLFVAPLLPVGNYTLTVSQPGFKTEVRKGITLTADQIATVNVSLSIGQVSQTVEVSANAEMVQTSSGTLGQLIGERVIDEMPLNGRNPASLVLLSPGAVNILSTSAGINQINVANPNDTGASVNGGRQGSVYYMLDGANNMDNENLLGSPMPNPDATEEFRVLQNNFDAQYGFAPSSIVSVVTRSGTNTWHGSAFEFLRNNALDAADFFSHKTDTLKRNQFGVSLGGPIKHDKLFIFGNYQRTTESQLLTGTSDFVPNNDQLNGDFSGLYTGKITNPCGDGGPSNLDFDTGQLFMPNPAAPYGSPVVCPTGSAKAGQTVMVKQPFANNFIDPTTFNSVSTKMNQSLPRTDAANGLVYLPGVSKKDTTDEFTLRADYNLNERHRISGRVFYQNFVLPANSGGGDFLAAQSSWTALYVNYAGSYVWTIKPNVINNFVASINLNHGKSYPGLLGSDGKPVNLQLYGAKINYPPFSVYPPGLDEFATNGFFILGNTNAPQFRRAIAFTDSVSYTKDKHLIVAGIDVLRYNYTNSNDWQASPRLTFDGEVTGNDDADYLLGSPNWYEQGGGEYAQDYYTSYQAYVQDTVRLKPNLSVNLGVRWQPYFPPSAVDGRMASFRPGQQSTRFPNAPLGLLFPGDSGVTSSTMHSSTKNFSPRVGIAWQPHALPGTSIRSAFGIFDVPISNMDYHHIGTVAPFSPIFDLYYNQIGLINLSDPWASWAPTGYTSPFPPFATLNYVPPSSVKFVTPFAVPAVFDPNYTLGKTQAWNFSIEHSLRQNILLTAAYVGSQSYHLTYGQEQNPGNFSAGGERTLYPQYAMIAMLKSWVNSSYHGLQISFEKRLSQGIQVTSNYTFSKCIDEGSAGESPGFTSVGDPFNLRWNRGVCDMNFPNIWVSHMVWQLPSLKQSRKVASTILGHWQLSGIWTLQSGSPFSISGGCNGSNNSLAQIGKDRADLTGQPFNVHQGSKAGWLQQYFNPSAFQCNAPGTFGNSGRNIMYGPGTNSADAGISKIFPIKERYKVQFRWEMFNAFNHPQFTNPNVNPVGPGFGGIFSLAAPPRIMQGALKVLW